MKWVTRERPKTDRIACPWLIKKFIDPEAEFLYVPAESGTRRRGTGGGPLLRRARSSLHAPGRPLLVRGAGRGIRPRRPGAAAPSRGSSTAADVAEDRDATPQSRGLLAVARAFTSSSWATTASSSFRCRSTTRSTPGAGTRWKAARRPDAARADRTRPAAAGRQAGLRPRRRLRAQAAPLRRAHRRRPGRRDRLRGAAAPPLASRSPGRRRRADRRSR